MGGVGGTIRNLQIEGAGIVIVAKLQQRLNADHA